MSRTRRVLHPVAGQMFDVSLVNKKKATQRDQDALIEVVKAEDIAEAASYADYLADLLELGAIEPDEGDPEQAAKATFSADDRKKLAESGEALADGSFPIRNAGDLKNAIRAIGRAKDPAAAKAHIKKRAAALGLTDQLTEAFKAEAVEAVTPLAAVAEPAEAAKAGAEFSAKNKDILSRIKGVLGRLLGEEASEPEHADIKSELEQAEALLEGKKAAPAEEIEMTAEEMAALLDAKLSPLAARMDAIEVSKAAVAPPVVTPDAEAEKAKAAAEVEAIEKARSARPTAAASDAIRLTTHEDGRAKLREVGKARKVEDRPSLNEGLRHLTNRNIQTGEFLDR